MRQVDPDLLAEIEKPSWRPVFAGRLDWPGGEVRYHTRLKETVLDGETWTAIGGLGSIEVIEETGGVKVRNVVLSITGFLSDQIERLRGKRVRNRAASLYLGAVDSAENQIGALLRIYRGQMRSKEFQIRDADQERFKHLIQVTVQSHTQAVRRPIDVRHEHPRLAALRHERATWPE